MAARFLSDVYVFALPSLHPPVIIIDIRIKNQSTESFVLNIGRFLWHPVDRRIPICHRKGPVLDSILHINCWNNTSGWSVTHDLSCTYITPDHSCRCRWSIQLALFWYFSEAILKAMCVHSQKKWCSGLSKCLCWKKALSVRAGTASLSPDLTDWGWAKLGQAVFTAVRIWQRVERRLAHLCTCPPPFIECCHWEWDCIGFHELAQHPGQWSIKLMCLQRMWQCRQRVPHSAGQYSFRI